jgi:hypothetical protein
LPVLIDPELTISLSSSSNDLEKDKLPESHLKEFWMPDRFCKVCYGCEEAFTMYRRRHHCRMCGQIFCYNCSKYNIDGALFNITGLVRACKLCYEQLFERTERERESRSIRKKFCDKSSLGEVIDSLSTKIASNPQLLLSSVNNFQQQQEVFQQEQSTYQSNLQNRFVNLHTCIHITSLHYTNS